MEKKYWQVRPGASCCYKLIVNQDATSTRGYLTAQLALPPSQQSELTELQLQESQANRSPSWPRCNGRKSTCACSRANLLARSLSALRRPFATCFRIRFVAFNLWPCPGAPQWQTATATATATETATASTLPHPLFVWDMLVHSPHTLIRTHTDRHKECSKKKKKGGQANFSHTFNSRSFSPPFSPPPPSILRRK